MQSTLNFKISDTWLSKPNDNLRAVWLEAAELVDSTAWKWWKKQDADLANVKVELIDIFHFLLSAVMVDIYKDMNEEHKASVTKNSDIHHFMFNHAGLRVFNVILEEYNKSKDMGYFNCTEDRTALEILRQTAEGIAKASLTKAPFSALKHFSTAWFMLGFTPEDLFKEYMVKNILNTFRQNHGYKDGSYIMNWAIDGKTYDEDNVLAYQFAKDLEVDEEFVPKLTSMLEFHYTQLEKLSKA